MKPFAFVYYKDYKQKQKFKKEISAEYKSCIDITSNDFVWTIFYGSSKDNEDYLKTLEHTDLFLFDEFQFMSALYGTQTLLASVLKARVVNGKATMIISDVSVEKLALCDTMADVISSEQIINICC